MKNTLAAVALAAAAIAAQAHQVWLEQDAKAAKLYFGEFGENLREASPGLLDKFSGPTVQRLSPKGDGTASVSKTPNGFAIATRAGKGESIVAEDVTYPLSERKEGDRTIRTAYMPAARLVTDFTQQSPKLALDLVPTGKTGRDGTEFQAFYKGQPLPKAKVVLVNVSGWGQEHHTGEDGKLSVKLPWRGTYVLELSHRDTTGGERGSTDKAEKWDRANFVTSLTVQQPSGLPTLPTPAAAPPNKAN